MPFDQTSTSEQPSPSNADSAMRKPAYYPILDGHNDVLMVLSQAQAEENADRQLSSFFEESEEGHIDLPRAQRGGLAGGFFAMFVPNPKDEDDLYDYDDDAADESMINMGTALSTTDSSTSSAADEVDWVTGRQEGTLPLAKPIGFEYAFHEARAMRDVLYTLEIESHGAFQVVYTVDGLERNIANHVVSAIFHFEGAEPIAPDLSNLDAWYDDGLRSLGLVWSRPNAFACGVPFHCPSSPDTGPGLTDAGRALVRACNDMGIMLDLSHLNEQGFWDVAKLSKKPLIASHSCAHAICPAARNLTDKQLDAIRDSDGIVGVNFFVGDMREDGRLDADTPLSDLVRQIDYISHRVGIDRVAFGSDFDGATMPKTLGDAAGLPNLIAALRQAGYNDGDLAKLTHGNWLRILRSAWNEESDDPFDA